MREKTIMPNRICMWIAADTTNTNENYFGLVKKRLNELKWNAFLKEKNTDFLSKIFK